MSYESLAQFDSTSERLYIRAEECRRMLAQLTREESDLDAYEYPETPLFKPNRIGSAV